MIACTRSGRRTGLVLAASLLLASGACGEPATQAGKRPVKASDEVAVSSIAQLESALKGASAGSVIRLSTGHYPVLALANVDTLGNVTVTSADPARPAVLGGLSLRGVSGVTFRNLSVVPDGDGDRRHSYGVLVMDCDDLTFADVTFLGAGDRIDPRFIAAMMLRNSSGIRVERSYFAFFHHGLAMLDVKNVHLRFNEFEQLQTDAIRGGGVSDAIIESNVMTGYHPAPKDHPDGIQLWSTNQKEPGRNIMIRDNLVVRGDGDPTQGVFVRDTKNTMPFENVTITGNLVIGSLYNGIAVNGVTGALIADNEVIAFPGRRSWIRVDNGSQVRLVNNRAERFVLRNNPKPIEEKNNRETNPTSKKIAERIENWLAGKPGFAEYRGPVLRRLLASQ